MFKKNLTQYLAIVLIGAAILGLYNDLYFTFNGLKSVLIKDIFAPVYLGVVFSRGGNYANAIFNVLLLLGNIFYLKSSGRETRLLRTALGIIFLSNLLALFSSIDFLLFLKEAEFRTFTIILLILLLIFKQTALIYYSQKSLRYLNQTKEFETEVYEHNSSTVSYSVVATKGQRITNTLLDCMITVLVFSPVVNFVLYRLSKYKISFLERIEDDRQMQIILVIFVICRIVYYIIFESLFASTPAKMMTETRVIEGDGGRPGFTLILSRTLCRLIPLEGLSFLTNAGLHDRLSNTNVVREKSTGKPGSNYYLILIILIIFIGSYNSVKERIEKRRIVSEANLENQDFKDELQRKLDHAGTNDFFRLQRINDYGDNGNGSQIGRFLKVERVRADSITFSIVKAYGKVFPPGQLEAEQAYKTGHDSLPHITLAKTDLKRAFSDKHETYTSQDSTVKGIKVANGTLYAIKNIDTYFQTNIETYNFFGYGKNYLSIGVKNTGWPANLIKVDVLEGGAVIRTKLPMLLKTQFNPNWADHIDATVDGDDVDFKMNITVQDTTDRIQVYQISGNSRQNSTRIIKRLK